MIITGFYDSDKNKIPATYIVYRYDADSYVSEFSKENILEDTASFFVQRGIYNDSDFDFDRYKLDCFNRIDFEADKNYFINGNWVVDDEIFSIADQSIDEYSGNGYTLNGCLTTLSKEEIEDIFKEDLVYSFKLRPTCVNDAWAEDELHYTELGNNTDRICYYTAEETGDMLHPIRDLECFIEEVGVYEIELENNGINTIDVDTESVTIELPGMYGLVDVNFTKTTLLIRVV